MFVTAKENVMQKKKILFGAGLYGHIALEKYGKENVAFFVDNNSELCGNKIEGIPVINVNKLQDIYENFQIVITTKYSQKIAEQLLEMNIKDFDFFSKEEREYPTDELIVNPYTESNAKSVNSTPNGIKQRMVDIEMKVEELYRDKRLFDRIEIETINRCNGNCSFCPVSRQNDTRKLVKMSQTLFENIIDQLSDIDYGGKLALFSNNEPFLDENIIEKHKYAREKLPHAWMGLYTNGTLLTIDKFKEIVKYLDELIIDNYQQDLKLIKPCVEIKKYCDEHTELKKKVTIVLRKQQELLTNRGGDAPNRGDKVSYPSAKCVLPFRQLIIRPDGKVSLCCNDPLGRDTLADLNKEKIIDAWYNSRFQIVRKCLYEGRMNWEHCKYCDVFNIG